jgi:AbrB family looped-hinge helix DNA binding protein
MGKVATLSSKFQISIPKEVREAHGWRAGQRFAFIPNGVGGVTIHPVPKLNDLRGVAKGATDRNYRDREDRYWCWLSTRRLGWNGSVTAQPLD